MSPERPRFSCRDVQGVQLGTKCRGARLRLGKTLRGGAERTFAFAPQGQCTLRRGHTCPRVPQRSLQPLFFQLGRFQRPLQGSNVGAVGWAGSLEPRQRVSELQRAASQVSL